jgi:predicted  nucleic acid-binding Zn-ribbon protein
MRNNILHDKVNGNGQNTVFDTLRSIEQKLEKEIEAKQEMIQWQRSEISRLQWESTKKSHTIAELNNRLGDCRSHVEGNRQLINKLIGDIDKLQQNVAWYKRTYESRSLFGVIKDKLKHLLS